MLMRETKTIGRQQDGDWGIEKLIMKHDGLGNVGRLLAFSKVKSNILYDRHRYEHFEQTSISDINTAITANN